MCDYSLMAIPNRLAEEGEDLVAHRFPTGPVGFASATDLRITVAPHARPQGFWLTLKNSFNRPKANPVPAVCVPPGARLMLQDIPTRLQHDLGIGPAEEVNFTQLTALEYTSLDAVRFQNGHDVLLQKLPEGQRVKVLDLSSAEALEPSPERIEGSFHRR